MLLQIKSDEGGYSSSNECSLHNPKGIPFSRPGVMEGGGVTPGTAAEHTSNPNVGPNVGWPGASLL